MRRAVREMIRRAGDILLDRNRVIAIGILLLVLLVRTVAPTLIEVVQLRGFDLLQQAFPRTPGEREVVIVDIDDASLAQIGQWPWPRTVVAELVDKLTAAGARVIGFDMIFAEPDRLSPPHVAETIRGLDAGTRGVLEKYPDNDTVLAQSLRRSRVVLGEAAQSRQVPTDSGQGARPVPVVTIGGDPRPHLFWLPTLIHNLPELEAAAKGRGLITVLPEFDGVVRRVPLALVIGNDIHLGLANELLRVMGGKSAAAIKVDAAGITQLVAGRYIVPTDEYGRMWVHYTRHRNDLYLSAKDVLAGVADSSRVAGKIVLVGTSAIGLQDLRPTPLDASIPGVEIHAQILETILQGSYLSRPGWAPGAELVLVLLLGLIMIMLVPRVGARVSFLILFILAALIGGSSVYAFSVHRLLFDGTLPLATAGILYTVLVYMNYSREESERRRIRGAFAQYLSPAVVEQLARDPAKLSLGGEVRNMSFLFCDIRGFTAVSEQFKSNPRDLTALINRFLTPMTEAIHECSGTIDKYIGDCVMAFWNAPIDDAAHAQHACEAALTMLEKLQLLNAELRAEAESSENNFFSSHDYRKAKQLSEGEGDERDPAKAFAIFRAEAEKGYAAAQYNLGKAYRDGHGVTRDLVSAAAWFRAAAEQGHAKAQERLGVRYLRGEGVRRDLIEALAWLVLAARNGLASAEEPRRALMGELSANDVAEAEARAEAMAPRIAHRLFFQIEVGIGINSGDCIVGNLGSEQRFDYSVLGDAVNLAARLESLSKDYGIPVLIGEETHSRISGLAAIEVDLITVKGKREPSRVFGLLGGREMYASSEFQDLLQRHRQFLSAYREQRWREAREMLALCRRLSSGLDELYDLYAERLEYFEAEPPHREWRGIATAHRK